jgi:hypothetical protein
MSTGRHNATSRLHCFSVVKHSGRWLDDDDDDWTSLSSIVAHTRNFPGTAGRNTQSSKDTDIAISPNRHSQIVCVCSGRIEAVPIGPLIFKSTQNTQTQFCFDASIINLKALQFVFSEEGH